MIPLLIIMLKIFQKYKQFFTAFKETLSEYQISSARTTLIKYKGYDWD